MNDDMTLFTDNAAKDFSEPEVTEFDTQLEAQLFQDGDDTGWDDIKSTVHGMIDDVMKQWVSLESDMLLHSNFDKLATISQVIQDSGTITQADRITLESLGVDINRLPIISSYTKTPSRVNQVVTLEAINAAMAVAIGVIAVALAALLALLKKMLGSSSSKSSKFSGPNATALTSKDVKQIEENTQKTLAKIQVAVKEGLDAPAVPVREKIELPDPDKMQSKTTNSSTNVVASSMPTPEPVFKFDKKNFENDLREWLDKRRSLLTEDERTKIITALTLNNLTNSPKDTQARLFDALISNRLLKANLSLAMVNPEERILQTGSAVSNAISLMWQKIKFQIDAIAQDNGQTAYASIINTTQELGLMVRGVPRNELSDLLKQRIKELKPDDNTNPATKQLTGTNMQAALRYFQTATDLDRNSTNAISAVKEMPNTLTKLRRDIDKLKSSQDFPGKAQLVKNYEIVELDLRLNILNYVYLERILWFRNRVWEATMSVHTDCKEIAQFVANYFGVK